jgi:hypothetical protein
MKDNFDNIEDDLFTNNGDDSTDNFLKIDPIKNLDSSFIQVDLDVPKKEPDEEIPLKIKRPKMPTPKKVTNVSYQKKPQKKSNLVIILLIVFLFINLILGLAYFVYTNFFANKNNSRDSVTTSRVTQEPIKQPIPIREQTPIQQPVVKNEPIQQDYSKHYENQFGRVVNDKYVGGSLIQFIKNANTEGEYEYLKNQFYQILDTMYVTEDKVTYYYLNDIISNLADKADTNMLMQEDFTVKGKKLYYTVSFPKNYAANTPSWVKFEIFEREFKDGLALRTAHVSCAINGVEYKDWEAVYAIFD